HRRIATASVDGGVRVWDVESGMPVSERLSSRADNDKAQDRTCATPWFTNHDRHVSVVPASEAGKREGRPVTWTIDIAVTPKEASQFAELARQYFGARVSPSGVIELIP